MVAPNNSSDPSRNGDPSFPDKNLLWGWWYKSAQWQDDLHRQGAYKALDIPDPMSVQANKTFVGITWKELVVAGAIGYFALNHFREPDPPASPPPPVQQQPVLEFVDTDTDTIGILEVDE